MWICLWCFFAVQNALHRTHRRDLTLKYLGVFVRANWTCESSDQAARSFQRENSREPFFSGKLRDYISGYFEYVSLIANCYDNKSFTCRYRRGLS